MDATPTISTEPDALGRHVATFDGPTVTGSVQISHVPAVFPRPYVRVNMPGGNVEPVRRLTVNGIEVWGNVDLIREDEHSPWVANRGAAYLRSVDEDRALSPAVRRAVFRAAEAAANAFITPKVIEDSELAAAAAHLAWARENFERAQTALHSAQVAYDAAKANRSTTTGKEN